MGFATFIEEKFIGKEICVFIDNDAESIIYDQSWVANKVYFRGVASEITDNILTLHIENVGNIYISCDEIVAIWEPPFEYHKAIRTSLTGRMVGARK